MKKIAVMLIALVLASPLAASAAEGSGAPGKDACLLDSTKCAGMQQDTIVEVIAKLQAELGKGASVYTADELKRLGAKLDQYELLLVSMTAN